MTISFNEIPINLRTPGVYAEFDNSRAIRGLPGMPYTALLIGQRLTAGTVAAGIATGITNADQAKSFFGDNSMLHHMAQKWFANNAWTKVKCIALDDNGAGAAATGTLTITGTASETGTLNIMIGGRRVQVAVSSGDMNTAIAAAIDAKITADKNLAVVSSVSTNVVTITARHKGEVGNDIDLRLNYYTGEATPAGVTVAIAAMSGGTANPDITSLITAMADDWYNIIAMPYTDAANLTLLEAEMADRWGPMRSIEGHAFAAADGSHGAMTTLGNSRNSPHLSIAAMNDSPNPPYEMAAAMAGLAGYYGNIDPARPFQTLAIDGILPPAESARFTKQERNLLLFDGIATTTVDDGGVVRVERMTTTYETNTFGTDDISYLDVNTMLTLGFLRYSFRARFAQQFPRHKLADDGNRFGAGQAVITPKIARAEVIALFRLWEDAALVENIDQFKADLVVERNQTDPNRLDILLPPDLVNQLRVTAAQIQFRL